MQAVARQRLMRLKGLRMRNDGTCGQFVVSERGQFVGRRRIFTTPAPPARTYPFLRPRLKSTKVTLIGCLRISALTASPKAPAAREGKVQTGRIESTHGCFGMFKSLQGSVV